MSEPLRLKSASLKTIFTDKGTTYEIALDSHFLEYEDGTMTWATEEHFHIEKEGFVCRNAWRPAFKSKPGLLKISIEPQIIRIIDSDGDRTFVGDRNLIENFSREINRIAN